MSLEFEWHKAKSSVSYEFNYAACINIIISVYIQAFKDKRSKLMGNWYLNGVTMNLFLFCFKY